MLDYLAIGKKIRALRKSRELSQEQLAEMVWISTTHMSHIETGSTKLSLQVLVDLAKALSVGTDEILSMPNPKKGMSESIADSIASCTPRQVKVIEALIKAVKENVD